MSATSEIDPILKHSLKLLHSANSDSAEKIRICLDEIINQRYDGSKIITNNINKKYLAEESTSPGVKIVENPEIKAHVSRGSTIAAIQAAESVVVNVDESDEENLKVFCDLTCVVCGAMAFTACNRLIECADCRSLYHQECHKPPIKDVNEQDLSWICTNCKNKVKLTKTSTATVSPSKSSSSQSSSSSSSSSPCYPTPEHSSLLSKMKSNSFSKGNSSSLKGNSSTNSSATTTHNVGNVVKTSTLPVTPSINLISADKITNAGKHSQGMKKKSHDTKRKSK